MVRLLFLVGLATGALSIPSVARAADALQGLNTTVRDVDFDGVSARTALAWLSSVADFDLVVSERWMEAGGIDLDQPITLNLRAARAERVLKIIANELAGPEGMVIHANRAYIRLLTREQANRDAVVRVHRIGDLLHLRRSYDNAPEIAPGGREVEDDGGGIFAEVDDEAAPAPRSPAERAQDLMDLIRRNVEPNLWEANGGLVARMSYYNGMLIVRAPRYVQQQIGPAAAPDRASRPGRSEAAAAAPAGPRSTFDLARRQYRPSPRFDRRDAHLQSGNRHSNGVSGINTAQRFLE